MALFVVKIPDVSRNSRDEALHPSYNPICGAAGIALATIRDFQLS
jgi:hypothetical protein